jgi:hypothetical protein
MFVIISSGASLLRSLVELRRTGRLALRAAPNGEFFEPDQADATCPVLSKKIFRLTRRANHFYNLRRPVPKEGRCATSSTLGAGCGGRFGGARRAARKRTAKSCGPDAPTLASSGPRCFRIVACDGGKKARSPGRARRKPLKPSACGNAGLARCDRGDYARVVLIFPTRGCGCACRPAFPTPSLGGTMKQDSGAFASRECEGAPWTSPLSSSLRTQRPITTGRNYCAKAGEQRLSKLAPRLRDELRSRWGSRFALRLAGTTR